MSFLVNARRFFYREQAAKLYSASAYNVAQLLAGMRSLRLYACRGRHVTSVLLMSTLQELLISLLPAHSHLLTMSHSCWQVCAHSAWRHAEDATSHQWC